MTCFVYQQVVFIDAHTCEIDKDICLIEAQCLKTEADTILSDNKSEIPAMI